MIANIVLVSYAVYAYQPKPLSDNLGISGSVSVYVNNKLISHINDLIINNGKMWFTCKIFNDSTSCLNTEAIFGGAGHDWLSISNHSDWWSSCDLSTTFNTKSNCAGYAIGVSNDNTNPIVATTTTCIGMRYYGGFQPVIAKSSYDTVANVLSLTAQFNTTQTAVGLVKTCLLPVSSNGKVVVTNVLDGTPPSGIPLASVLAIDQISTNGITIIAHQNMTVIWEFQL